MEDFITVLREFGSFGIIMAGVVYFFYMMVKKIAPAFDRLSNAIDENTEYLRNKNGTLERHMEAQDKRMEIIQDEISKIK